MSSLPPAPAAPENDPTRIQPPEPRHPRRKTFNELALIAFVGAFFVNIVGIVCGHIALVQIKRSGERGRGFALAGLIIGYVSVLATIGIVASVVVGGAATSQHASPVHTGSTHAPSAAQPSSLAPTAAECATVERAGVNLASTIASVSPTVADSPEAAIAAIDEAAEAWSRDTADVDSPLLNVDALTRDLHGLSGALDSLRSGDPYDIDTLTVDINLSAVRADLQALGSWCD